MRELEKRRAPLRSVLIGVALLLSLFSCRVPPDITPFTSSTSQLITSVKLAGTTIESEVARLTKHWSPTDREASTKILADFRKQWAGRNGLGDALLDYSASLTAIVNSGATGSDSVKAVGDSFQSLTSAVGLAVPATPAVQGVIDMGAYLYGLYANNQATETLGESMQQMQEAIDETARVLADSLGSCVVALEAIHEQVPTEYGTRDVQGIKLTTRRNTIKFGIEELNDLAQKVAQARKAVADETGDRPAESKALLELLELLADRTARQSSLRFEMALTAPLEREQKAELTRIEQEMQLIRRTQDGLRDWASAHASIAAASRKEQPLKIEGLLGTAMEIRSLVDNIRNKNRE